MTIALVIGKAESILLRQARYVSQLSHSGCDGAGVFEVIVHRQNPPVALVQSGRVLLVQRIARQSC